MKSARQTSCGKRSRTVNLPVDEDDAHTDDDHRPDDHVTRPPQAERKRELERNRRNLVNVRFNELEAELRRCAPRVESPASSAKTDPATKGRRIDKEAVLKEAAQRLAVQRKEIASSAERLANMNLEIDNLRAEKVELRGDKSYLRDELDTVRGDVQRLRSDNLHLWQAVKNKASIKNAFAPDVAKIPADLFLRSKSQEHHPQLPSSAVSLGVHTSIPVAPASQPPSCEFPGHLQEQQGGHPNADPTQNSRQVNSDAYLVFQSPDELGELFTSYVPGTMGGLERPFVTGPTQLSEQRQSNGDDHHNVMSQGLSALAHITGAQPTYEHDGQQPYPNTVAKAPDITKKSNSDSPASQDKGDEDPLSDIACCV